MYLELSKLATSKSNTLSPLVFKTISPVTERSSTVKPPLNCKVQEEPEQKELP